MKIRWIKWTLKHGIQSGSYLSPPNNPCTKERTSIWSTSVPDMRMLTECNGSVTPNCEEDNRKLANFRNSLSAILGRIYSSEIGSTKRRRISTMLAYKFSWNKKRQKVLWDSKVSVRSRFFRQKLLFLLLVYYMIKRVSLSL